MDNVRFFFVLSSRLMSAVISVIVRSVSKARVRTPSILLKSAARSAFASCILCTASLSEAVCVATRAERSESRSYSYVRNLLETVLTVERVEGWENNSFR